LPDRLFTIAPQFWSRDFDFSENLSEKGDNFKQWGKDKSTNQQIKVFKNYKKQRYYLASGYIFNY